MDYSPGKHRFRSWLATVIKNTVRTYQTRQSKNPETTEEKVVEMSIEHPEIDSMIETEWENYLANLAMNSVKSRFQPQVIQAFHYFLEGKTAPQVADLLSIEVNTAHVYKLRVQNAMFKEIVRLDNDLG